MAIEETELLGYACQKFQDEKYDEALEAFVLAFQKGYEKDWVKENIYKCYMSGNEETFQKTYEENEKIQNIGIKYEDCKLDFIPYKDGQYFIFDKEADCFWGVFSMAEIEDAEEDKALQESEFSSVAVALEWNWNKERTLLQAAGTRRIYAVCHDIKRCVSFWKIPELKGYVENICLFPDQHQFQMYFHKNTDIYLPKLVYGRNAGEQDELVEILNQEHQYRITPEGRNTENVLLTIGIPTHARGNLLLKRLENLRKLPLDSEIEFAISKNGIQLYQEEYKKASEIRDARINYYDHECELSPEENWCHVMEMAHGKYVLLVSDEDDIVLGNVEHYLKLLESNPEVNLVRASGAVFYTDIKEPKYKKGGLDAFGAVFLRQNYLSGLIIRRKDFLKKHFEQLKQFRNNEYYHRYPHDWWCSMLSMEGDYLEDPVCLISENESVMGEEVSEYKKLGILPEGDGFAEETTLPKYATYNERLKQFRGQIDFLHWLMQDNLEGCEKGLIGAIGKVSLLLELAYEQNYDCDNFSNVVDEFVLLSMEAIDEFTFREKQKLVLLNWVTECAVHLLELNNKRDVF